MDPVLRVALALAVFAATHLGLSWPPIRQPLVARLGPWGFSLLFSVIAWITFGVVLSTYASNANEGPPGLALGAYPVTRVLLIGVIALGAMLMVGAFAGYARTPYMPSGAAVAEPRGLARVTRHPFFVGVALLGLAHALLATRMVGALAMGGLGAYALVGSWLQDRKLVVLRGEPYERYLAASSLLPFVAIVAGRQRLVWSELPYGMLLLGLVLAWLLRAVHASLFAHGGLYIMIVLVIGPLSILVGQLRRDRRARRPTRAVAEG